MSRAFGQTLAVTAFPFRWVRVLRCGQGPPYLYQRTVLTGAARPVKCHSSSQSELHKSPLLFRIPGGKGSVLTVKHLETKVAFTFCFLSLHSNYSPALRMRLTFAQRLMVCIVEEGRCLPEKHAKGLPRTQSPACHSRELTNQEEAWN